MGLAEIVSPNVGGMSDEDPAVGSLRGSGQAHEAREVLLRMSDLGSDLKHGTVLVRRLHTTRRMET
jgi:hypothetical protein